MVYVIYILSVPAGLLLTSYYLGIKKKLFFTEFLLIFIIPLISSYFLYLYEGGGSDISFFSVVDFRAIFGSDNWLHLFEHNRQAFVDL